MKRLSKITKALLLAGALFIGAQPAMAAEEKAKPTEIHTEADELSNDMDSVLDDIDKKKEDKADDLAVEDNKTDVATEKNEDQEANKTETAPTERKSLVDVYVVDGVENGTVIVHKKDSKDEKFAIEEKDFNGLEVKPGEEYKIESSEEIMMSDPAMFREIYKIEKAEADKKEEDGFNWLYFVLLVIIIGAVVVVIVQLNRNNKNNKNQNK